MHRPFSLSVQWTTWHGDGHESLELFTNVDNEIVVESHVIWRVDSTPIELNYRMVCNSAWIVQEVALNVVAGANVHLIADGQGNWAGPDNRPVPHLEGCIDVDIAVTPFTNTLPIRRLGLSPGQSANIRVAFFDVPSLTVKPVDQRYTRQNSGNCYLYEGLSSDFQCEITVDDDGLVLEYPDAFRRA